MTTDAAAQVLRSAVGARTFPCAVGEVGGQQGPIWQHAIGTLAFDGADHVAVDTPFDLASLTKVLATTAIAMRLAESAVLLLETPLAELFDEWRGSDRESATVRDLLEHASGLPARLVDSPPASRREMEHEICAIPLEYAPRARSVYSDLGFILLGFAEADRGGQALPLLFRAMWPDESLTFELNQESRRRAAPTLPLDDDPRRGRVLRGEVHDSYAAALGGVAGHAGLFGSASAVGAFARAMLRAAKGREDGPFSPVTVARFLQRSEVAGSSRALGWDTMLQTSSCGTRMSAAAFGHVGFTGTSLWIDPDRDRYFVLLTNRVCGGGSLDAMRDVRRAFHDALGDV
jgi:CubicO group peptidase (beta-lactamase class C family)